VKSNFDKALDITLAFEGGFVDHPADPGGRTMKGVTQKVYDKYRSQKGHGPQDVKLIGDYELRDIYKIQYWDQITGDMLPSGVDVAVFDYAVNSGPTRATRALQQICAVRVDGSMGLGTIAAVKQLDTEAVIEKLCDERLAFVRRLSTFKVFGKGWTRRINAVRVAAIKLTAQNYAFEFDDVDELVLASAEATDGENEPADPRQVSFMSTNTGKGVATSGLGVMGTTVGQAAEKMQDLSHYSPIIVGVSVFLLLVGTGLSMYGLYKAVAEERAA
jgi:lysozyme family protein